MRNPFLVFVFVAALAVSVLVIVVLELAPDEAHRTRSTFRPALHAGLNGTCAAVLLVGYWFIRQKKKHAHRTCMILAGLLSATFLASYLQYHSVAGSTPFQGRGAIRPVYFALLLSHTVLAAVVAPLAAGMYWFAATRRWDRHRRVARWTLPIWIYTSITGVLIYYMLHVWFA